VRLELEALCAWRDVHGERSAFGEPEAERLADGLAFEGAYRVRGPGFAAEGVSHRGVRHREEAARGLNPLEDLFLAGRFAAELRPARRGGRRRSRRTTSFPGKLGAGQVRPARRDSASMYQAGPRMRFGARSRLSGRPAKCRIVADTSSWNSTRSLLRRPVPGPRNLPRLLRRGARRFRPRLRRRPYSRGQPRGREPRRRRLRAEATHW